jgi:hypothetical protein
MVVSSRKGVCCCLCLVGGTAAATGACVATRVAKCLWCGAVTKGCSKLVRRSEGLQGVSMRASCSLAVAFISWSACAALLCVCWSVQLQ